MTTFLRKADILDVATEVPEWDTGLKSKVNTAEHNGMTHFPREAAISALTFTHQ